MSEWLGKPRLEHEDLPTRFKDLSMYVKYYEESQSVRISIKIPRDALECFRKTVVKRFGVFSAGNARRAVEEAVKTWMKNVEGRRFEKR
jgi:hypothetical protein